MTNFSVRLSFSLPLLLITAVRLEASPIQAGSTLLPGTAYQDLTLLPNTPFNPTSSPILFDNLSGDGYITLNRNLQVGATIAIDSVSGGQFFGAHPSLGSYVFGIIPPLTGADFSGGITSVVQNPLDPGFASGAPSSFESGNFAFGGASFGFEFLTGPVAGITLFTDSNVPFGFSGTFNGLPPAAGTVLLNSGTGVLNVLFNGQVVGTSSDRRFVIASIPEPVSPTVIALGALGLIWRLRDRAAQGRPFPRRTDPDSFRGVLRQ